jgi:hypothetical protein
VRRHAERKTRHAWRKNGDVLSGQCAQIDTAMTNAEEGLERKKQRAVASDRVTVYLYTARDTFGEHATDSARQRDLHFSRNAPIHLGVRVI